MRASIGAIVFGSMVGLALAAVGCGNDDSSGAGNKDQFISQLCAELSACCAAADRPTDGAQCRAFYGAFAPSAGYDEAAASTCLSEVRALGADKCDAASMSTPSCRKVFASEGSQQPGEECEDSTDCAQPAEGEADCVSDLVDDATVQQCQVQLRGEAGSTPCLGTVEGNLTSFFGSSSAGIPTTGYLCHVADGLACDSSSGACQALGAAGEPCSGGFYDCVPSAYCDFSESLCKERLAVGATCGSDEECEETAHCNEGACAARRDKGESCATNAECLSDNCTNQACGAEDDLGLIFLCGS